MSTEALASQIGHAWGHQRNGEAETAIQEFEQILKQSPNEIDAHYGLGLAYRDARKYPEAIDHFQRALELVTERDSAGRAAREAALNETEGRLKPNTLEDDRYMMLTRMLKQRLDETQQASTS